MLFAGLIGMSDSPGMRRKGGAERVPFCLEPNLAAETTWRASETVLTCGMMIEAPASRAKPIEAWSWPGTLDVEIVRFYVEGCGEGEGKRSEAKRKHTGPRGSFGLRS